MPGGGGTGALVSLWSGTRTDPGGPGRPAPSAGPGFCVWLDRPDYQEFGAQIQAIYDTLPGEWANHPARRETPEDQGRVGVLCIQDWYTRYTGLPDGPRTLEEWRRVPEAFLATATNGAVFSDPLSRFTAVRRCLLEEYPEDLRLKKLAARVAIMAQAGQYNYPRCVSRGETVAAELRRQNFSDSADSFLMTHSAELMARIRDPESRKTHILEE